MSEHVPAGGRGAGPGSAPTATAGAPEEPLVAVATAELRRRVRAAVRRRIEAPPDPPRHDAGQEALDLVRELRRRGHRC